MATIAEYTSKIQTSRATLTESVIEPVLEELAQNDKNMFITSKRQTCFSVLRKRNWLGPVTVCSLTLDPNGEHLRVTYNTYPHGGVHCPANAESETMAVNADSPQQCREALKKMFASAIARKALTL